MSTKNSAPGVHYDPNANPADVAKSVSAMIQAEIPGTKARVISRTSSTDWILEIGVLSYPCDLSIEDVYKEMIANLTAIALRYGYDASHPKSDHFDKAFSINVSAHEDYWSQRQAAGLDPAYRTILPSQWLKNVKKGDILENLQNGHKLKVLSVSSSRYETDDGQGNGRLKWHAPRAAALRISGDLIRIAQGNSKNPDRHLLYRWTKT